MKQLFIEFDRKNLVIPSEDYEIFKNENYYIDDGTVHIFNEENNYLLVLDTNNKPEIAIFFNSIIIEGEVKQEILRIKHRLAYDIDPKNNLRQAQIEASSAIKETFTLLDNILVKRAKPNDNFRTFGFKYYVLDKVTGSYNVAISLQDRFSYLHLLSQLDYRFGISDD